MNNFFKSTSALLIVMLALSLHFSIAISGDYTLNNGRIGVIIMHGKGGAPNGHNSALVRTLRSEGFRVIEPKMPWFGSKGTARYSASLDNAFDAINEDVKRLQADGADIVFLVGHSMGAMAAFSYGAYRGGIEGVIGIAPGHISGAKFHYKITRESIDKARSMVTSGNGDKKTWFQDYNSGGRRPNVNTTPKIYLSYFEPDGKANMKSSLSKMKDIPILWIAPSQDPVTKKGYAKKVFNSAPVNNMSRYVVLNTSHRNAPSQSLSEVLSWIKAVSKRKLENN